MIVPSDGGRRNLIHCFNVTPVRVVVEGGGGGRGTIGIKEKHPLIKCIFGQHAGRDSTTCA
jgi:hypothetical protein